MLTPTVRYVIQVILLAVAYLAAATLGLMAFAIEPARVATAVWPASGIALAAVLLLGKRVWPAVWLGALLANGMNALVASGSLGAVGSWWGDLLGKLPSLPLATAAVIATGNTCEALLAAWLCRRWLPPAGTPFQRVEEVFLFAVVAGATAAVAATVGTVSVVLGGHAAWPQFPANWGTWWLGDVAGLMIVVPLVLAHAKTTRTAWSGSQWSELALLSVLLVLASQAIFGGWLSEQLAHHLLYVPLIFLIWVCLRFELAEVTLATALLSGAAIGSTWAGLGPFREATAEKSLFHVQMYMNLYALTGLTVAAVVARRRASEQRLQQSRQELEQIVRDRTQALTVANADLRQEMADRRRAEESVREREVRYRELIEHLHVGVVVHAADTSILLSNARAAELLGVAASQISGKTDNDSAWSFVREDGTPVPKDEYPVNRVLATRRPLRDLVYGINRPGSEDRCWVLVSALPEFSGEHELVRVVVTFMDVTELRRLQESERLRWDAALESIGDSVLITGTDGLIQYVNPAFERITGYSRAEVLGHNPRLLQSGQHDPAFYRQMWQTLADAKTWHGEFVDKNKDGGLYDAEATISQIRDAAGHAIGYVGVQRDISDRKRAERKLAELAATHEQLRLARSIQQSFFPRASPIVPGYDLCGASYAAEETGGDYFDYFPLPAGRVGIVVADVTGHGLGPALVMSQTRAYLRALLSLGLDVSELATRLNDFLAADLPGGRFVTLFLAQLDPRDGSFVYASAGHQCFLLGPRDEVQSLDSTSMPLGILPGRVPAARPETLQPGQMVLFLTDGIAETRSPAGVLFGIERALEVVRAHRQRAASEIVETLYRSTRAFAQDTPQQDDITTVILKVETPARPAGLDGAGI